MNAPVPTLTQPDPLSLLERLAPLVDEGMLLEIASADYGHDAPENYAQLRRMRDEGFVPEAGWVPMEVVELIRWSEPDERGWRAGGENARGHVMRAFCAAWLLRVGGEREEYVEGGGMETAIQLFGSLNSLEADFWQEASGLLGWFLSRWSPRHDDEDAMLGVLQLYFALRSDFADDTRSVEFCEWIVAREAAIGSRWQFDERWGLRGHHGNFQSREWHALGSRLAHLNLDDRDPALREWVRLIGESLAGI